MARVRVTGQQLEQGDWVGDRLVIYTTYFPRSYFNPDGPNSGQSEGTVESWTDTEIIVNDNALDETTISEVILMNDGTPTHQQVGFTVDPPIVVPPGGGGTPNITNAVAGPAGGQLTVYGTDLDTAYRWIMWDVFNNEFNYWDSNGPNAGLNGPGVTVNVTGMEVVVTDPALAGIDITLISARDQALSVLHDWSGSTGVIGAPLTYPTLESICSPAVDTIRFEGTNFLNATAGAVGYVIPRLADYGGSLNGGAMIYELADGSPDPAYDWVLVTHTDTVIEISNPRFTSQEPSSGPGDFVVTGVAFHSVTTENMYYYEPWGETFNTPVDGSGCP